MNIEEEYRKINDPYFDDLTYEVSNFGNIKNTKTGNVRTPFRGLLQIDSSSRKRISVGRMVALTFLAEPNIDYSKRRIKHIDGDVNNNRVENLMWMNSSKK